MCGNEDVESGEVMRRPGGTAMKAPSSVEYAVGEPMPGTKWVVRGKLGQGGMGLVLSVEKAGLIRGAMKVLLPLFAKQREFAEKFLAEVKVTARLQHPSIVQVLDFDRLADGTPFMVMERLRGRTLRAALRETRQHGKLWTASNAYAVAAQAAEGLYRAHSLEPSVVHRDVKPENIFLHQREASHDSVVKVMDFGVAAVVGERDRQSIGTPRYMAPEQTDGGEVSPQTDQYALALVVYEMLTGRLPWDVDMNDRKALAEAHRHAAPTPPSQFCPWLPARMDAPLLKALSKDPRARHGTLHGLMFELRGLQWIGDRPGMPGDANTTDPGALPDGGVVRDEPDGSELAELSDSWEPPTWPRAEGAGRPAKRSSVAGALGSPTASESLTTVVRAAVSEDHAPAAAAALDTPMTGASSPGREAEIRRKGALRRMALALGGASAVVVLFVSARIARAPREPATSGVQVIDNRSSGAAPAASELELGAQPPRSITEAVDVPRPPADSVAMPMLAAPAEPIAKTTSARPDTATNGLAARKTTAPPRPALRSAPAKTSVPDDGRDELILPAVTR
jgi:serine/threonine-protein kinase